VLLIARKVIKVISENQKNVVINNVVAGAAQVEEPRRVVIRGEPGPTWSSPRRTSRTS